MTDMKCPFCQQEMNVPKGEVCKGQQRCVCRNPNCEFDGYFFPVKLVSELIRTSKALDVATKCINWVIDTYRTGQDQEADVLGICEFAAEEIDQIKTTIKGA